MVANQLLAAASYLNCLILSKTMYSLDQISAHENRLNARCSGCYGSTMSINLAPIITRLTEQDREISLARQEIASFRNEILAGLDAQMVILQKLTQELAFSNEAIRRNTQRPEEHGHDISLIKKLLAAGG